MSIEDAMKKLVDLPADSEERGPASTEVMRLIREHHFEQKVEGEADLIEALEIGAAAESALSDSPFYRSDVLRAQQQVCEALYESTKEVEWVKKGLDFGREAIRLIVDHANEHQNPSALRPPSSYAYLEQARAYEKLYFREPEDSDLEYLRKAVGFWKLSFTSTIPCDFYEKGLTIKASRFKRYSELFIRLAHFDASMDFDPIISEARDLSNTTCTRDPDADISFLHFQLRGLLVIRWARTKSQKHLAELIEHGRIDINNPQFCSDPGGEYTSDSSNPKHALRIIATGFQFRVYMDQLGWIGEVSHINAAIALWEEYRSLIKHETLANLREDSYPPLGLQRLYKTRWETCKTISDGWKSDEMDIVWTKMQRIIRDMTDQEATNYIDWVTDRKKTGSTILMFGDSAVTGASYSLRYSVWEPLNSHRLLFLQQKDPDTGFIENLTISVNNWVREWADDGTFVLGGAIEGRDDDVLEHIKKYNESLEDE